MSVMASPIDFSLDTTSGQKRSLSELRGKVVLLIVESQEARGQNQALQDYLKAQAQASQELLSRLALVPVASLSKVGASPIARSMAKPIIAAAAKSSGMEIWLDWEGSVLKALGAEIKAEQSESQSNTYVLDKNLVPRWYWNGPCPSEQWPALIAKLRELAVAS